MWNFLFVFVFPPFIASFTLLLSSTSTNRKLLLIFHSTPFQVHMVHLWGSLNNTLSVGSVSRPVSPIQVNTSLSVASSCWLKNVCVRASLWNDGKKYLFNLRLFVPFYLCFLCSFLLTHRRAALSLSSFELYNTNKNTFAVFPSLHCLSTLCVGCFWVL